MPACWLNGASVGVCLSVWRLLWRLACRRREWAWTCDYACLKVGLALVVSVIARFSVITQASIFFLINGTGKNCFCPFSISLLSLRIKCHIEDYKCSFSKVWFAIPYVLLFFMDLFLPAINCKTALFFIFKILNLMNPISTSILRQFRSGVDPAHVDSLFSYKHSISMQGTIMRNVLTCMST